MANFWEFKMADVSKIWKMPKVAANKSQDQEASEFPK